MVGYQMKQQTVPAIAGCLFMLAGACHAEDISRYISENAPVIALTHALVIDGTGTPPDSLAGEQNLTSIELLVEAGIPALKVIQIATQNGAEALNVANDRGTVTVGKRADLIVIDGNPSEQIKDIRKIVIVFKNGIGYDPVALRQSAIGTIGGPRP